MRRDAARRGVWPTLDPAGGRAAGLRSGGSGGFRDVKGARLGDRPYEMDARGRAGPASRRGRRGPHFTFHLTRTTGALAALRGPARPCAAPRCAESTQATLTEVHVTPERHCGQRQVSPAPPN